MPKLTEQELATKIADGSIAAISIDTSVFDRYQCNLDYATLKKLDQFQQSHIDVLISEIVANEVKAHIERDAAKSQKDLRNALSAHGKRWRLTADEAAPLPSYQLAEGAGQFADRQFTTYVEGVGAEIVPASRSSDVANEVVRRYFAVEMPFEHGDKKKHEFPDAFALLSLEEVAQEAGRLILCVSADGGWQRFSEVSEHLICVDDLDAVLDLFNDAGRIVAKRVMELLSVNRAPVILGGIESAFESRLDWNDFDISADSPTDYNAEPLSAVLRAIDWDSATTPDVVAQDADTVTFTTQVNAQVEFTASFEFYVSDRIDKDYVTIGTEEESTTRWIRFDLALTVSRDMIEEPDLLEAEAVRRGFTALFGRIEPFRNENPTREKY